MKGNGAVQFYDFMSELSAQYTPDLVLDSVQNNLGSIIPSDMSLCISKIVNDRLYSIRWPHYADKTVVEFNTHYNLFAPTPFKPASASDMMQHDWKRFEHLEFVSDFMLPLGIYKTTGVRITDDFTREQLFISPHRSRRSPDFSEKELHTLFHAGKLISKILSMKSEIEWYRSNSLYACELEEGYEILSKRESEVTELLCKRMTMREIAELLHISPRTVERHVSHIYQKLQIDNRKDLLRKIHKELVNN